MTDEAKELTITREKIKAIMRAAIAEGLNANRMSHTAYGYGVDRRLEDIAKTKTVDVEILLTAALERKGKHPAWPAMVTVVEDTHRPSSYAKDFYYHDRESLEQRQPRVFAWAVRDTGTWLFIPGMGDDSCLDMARGAQDRTPRLVLVERPRSHRGRRHHGAREAGRSRTEAGSPRDRGAGPMTPTPPSLRKARRAGHDPLHHRRSFCC